MVGHVLISDVDIRPPVRTLRDDIGSQTVVKAAGQWFDHHEQIGGAALLDVTESE